MVETREQSVKDEKKEPRLRFRKKWMALLAVLFVAIPVICWILVKYAVDPVFEKQEMTLGAPQITCPLKGIVVVLEQTPHFIVELDLVLELNNHQVSKEVKIKEPRILELIYDVTAVEHSETVVTIAGRHKLKRNIINRLNEELMAGKVIQAYFTKFIIAKDPAFL